MKVVTLIKDLMVDSGSVGINRIFLLVPNNSYPQKFIYLNIILFFPLKNQTSISTFDNHMTIIVN